MSESPGHARRRYRRRATAAQGPANANQGPGNTPPKTPAKQKPAEAPATKKSTEPAATAAETPVQTQATGGDPGRRRRPARETGERGLRDLVGSGRSQLGVGGALRGRDVNRPTDEDLAEAERDTVIVRRNWRPAAED
jgi:hypothetical protein